MPTYINYNILGDDSIKIFLSDSIVVGLCSRQDFPKLSEIEEVHKPGIYILLDGNKRYVGQATGGVHTRLYSHEKGKDWWTELVFIAHAYGALSPDKLNYLETKLIADFSELGYEMDNGNGGNRNSYIAIQQKIEAEKFIHDALEGLRNIGNIELYAKPARRRVSKPNENDLGDKKLTQKDALEENTLEFVIRDEANGVLVESKYLAGKAGAITKYVEELAKNETIANKLRDLAHTNPVDFQKDIRLSEKGAQLNSQILSDLWLHINVSRQAGVKLFERIKEQVSPLATLEISTKKDVLSEVPKKRKIATRITNNLLGTLTFESRGGMDGAWMHYIDSLVKNPEYLKKLYELEKTSPNSLLEYNEGEPEQVKERTEVAANLWVCPWRNRDNMVKYIALIDEAMGLDTKIEELDDSEVVVIKDFKAPGSTK